MNIFIYPNFDKNNAYDTTLKTIDILIDSKISVYMDNVYKDRVLHNEVKFDELNNISEKIDIIIVIGGDGTILKSSKVAAKYKIPLLGINTGRLGFMASIEADDLDKLKMLTSGNYTTNKRTMLNIKHENNGNINEYIALNDAVMSRIPTGNLPEFEIESNGEQVSKIRADGIIFSTPTGSTAYALSAGGPIIEPDVRCIEVTQICAFSLFSKPMLFSSNKILTVKPTVRENESITLLVDGEDVGRVNSQSVITVTESEYYTEIIDINGSAFYKAIDKKLMTPMK